MVLGVAVNVLDMGMSGNWFPERIDGRCVALCVTCCVPERGAGDLKLLASLGAMSGPEFVLWCGLWAGVAGGVLAIGVLLVRRNIGPVLAGMTMRTQRRVIFQLPAAISGCHMRCQSRLAPC